MNISGIATYGSAAIATPPSDVNTVKRDDKPADAPPAPIEASKAPGTGQVIDRTV